MADTDRTEKLAKAIEEMVQGRMPDGLDDEELNELLRIAKIRLDAARTAAEAGAETQASVLERLIARLNLKLRKDDNGPDGADTSNEIAGETATSDDDPERFDVKELQDIISLRRQMADHAAAISETHRDAVWQRVEARIRAEESARRGLFRWPFRRRNREIEDFNAALDRMILGEPIWEAANSNLEELLQVAQARRATAVSASSEFADQRARVWSRLRPRIIAGLTFSGRPRVFKRKAIVRVWPKLAVAGATAALVVAALGPIPATGLANHPITQVGRLFGGHSGVTETSEPPSVPPVTEVVTGTALTAEQASAMLATPVFEPTVVPEGYERASAEYFGQALTAPDGGLFVLAYENATEPGSPQTILIYQEHVSTNSIAVEQGFAQDVYLTDGTPATYVNGTWRPLGSNLTWGVEDSSTVVFDLESVRTVITATDSRLPLSDLIAVADSLAAQAHPPVN